MTPEQPTSENAFRALLRTFGLLRRVMGPYFARFGLSGSQWGVLRILYRAEADGEPRMRLTDLGSRLLVRPPSVTGIIARLRQMSLVERSASSEDLRERYVRLSTQGRKLVKRIMAGHSEQIDQVLGGLNKEEQEHLRDLLDRLSDHLQEVPVPTDEKRVLETDSVQ